MTAFVSGALILALLFPFLFLISQFGVGTSLDVPEFIWAFKNTFGQALGSSLVSLLLGVWAARGLLGWPARWHRWRRVFELLLLLPNFLPPLFTLLAAFNLIDPFPMGWPGVIIVHVALNWGLCAVVIASLVENKAGRLAEVAWSAGISRRSFLWNGLRPLLAKDLGLLGVFVFAVSFASFSVPLVVGGGRGTTLEVLIYEKIRLSGEWGQAVSIAAIQSVILFALASLAGRGAEAVQRRSAAIPYLRSRSGLVLVIVGALTWLVAYLLGLREGFESVDRLQGLALDLSGAFLGSLSLGLTTGFLCLAMMAIALWAGPPKILGRFLSAYAAPSQALAAFAFLVVLPNEGAWPFVKIPLALSTAYLPSLWRLGARASIGGLDSQVQVARLLGASRTMIFQEIVWPQLSARLSTLAGLAAVWACGDFAVSRLLAHRDLSLAMMTETLMSGYRLNLAAIVSTGVILAAGVSWFVLKGVVHVMGRKSESR